MTTCFGNNVSGVFLRTQVRGRVLGGGGQRIPVPGQAHQERGRGVWGRELHGGVLRAVRAGDEGEEGRLPGGLQVYQRPLQGGWVGGPLLVRLQCLSAMPGNLIVSIKC